MGMSAGEAWRSSTTANASTPGLWPGCRTINPTFEGDFLRLHRSGPTNGDAGGGTWLRQGIHPGPGSRTAAAPTTCRRLHGDLRGEASGTSRARSELACLLNASAPTTTARAAPIAPLDRLRACRGPGY